MKVFSAHGFVPAPCGCCDPDLATDEIIIAVTALEALGLALERYPITQAEHWDIEEVKLTHSHVHG